MCVLLKNNKNTLINNNMQVIMKVTEIKEGSPWNVVLLTSRQSCCAGLCRC